MMKSEFEALAGYEVSYEDYNNIIEKMYMATNMSKSEFIKCIDKKRFALKPISKIVKEMKKVAESIEDSCTHYHDNEAWDKLEELVMEYKERKFYGMSNVTFSFSERTKWSCYFPYRVEFFTTTKMLDEITLIEA